MLAIAHRSGNSVAGLREALDAGVDLVEADVHAYRGGLEIRHHKTLGPTHLWDRWEIHRRAEMVYPDLDDLLAELGADPRLMLDLKGVSRRLAPACAEALRIAAPGAAVAACTKHWWMLDAFDPAVRRVLSASNRPALARLRRRLATAPVFGVSVHLDLLTPATVAGLARSADVVMTWPVDSAAALDRARALGVGGVISKDLALLARVMAAE